jgi:2-pyrone-4,6-dicarboxylate lactonase
VPYSTESSFHGVAADQQSEDYMRLLKQCGVCDCHSHVFGPFTRFPLSSKRTFDPPEAPIEKLEIVWQGIGVDRQVLVQGSAYGSDHNAVLAAIARSPETRRGVALLTHDIDEPSLKDLHHGGIRAVRFNWINHLLRLDSRSELERLDHAGKLLEKVFPLRWHAEVHIDITDLDLLERIALPAGMTVVIDHMARMDASAADLAGQVDRLLTLLAKDRFWVKLSGADRLSANRDDLKVSAGPMRQILQVAPDRCVWGLDWPHVNLSRQRSDRELAELLLEVIGDEETLEKVLIRNPARLYGFGLEEEQKMIPS